MQQESLQKLAKESPITQISAKFFGARSSNAKFNAGFNIRIIPNLMFFPWNQFSKLIL